MTENDLKLSEALTRLQTEAGYLNRLHRDGMVLDLWKALSVMRMESEKAMFRLLDLKK